MPFVFAAGFGAGLLGGLLGIGGGIVMMPVLRFALGLDAPMAAGTCVTAVVFTTLAGAVRHAGMGQVRLRPILPIVMWGAASTAAFSLAFPWLARGHSRWLDLGVGAAFLLISGRMILEGCLESAEETVAMPAGMADRGWHLPAIGIAAGALPGLLGIGTGAILVPAFVYLRGWPMKVAIGSSLSCFFPLAFLSACFKAAQGHVDARAAVMLGIGAVAGSVMGASLTRYARASWLKAAFGVLFLYVAFQYVRLFFEVPS
ncbi:MAG: sulfite exporter TauE/SafE family protein [Elusimicrobiota bacterium]